MNCDNCRWFNKTGFVPGFGDCVLNRDVHSANHESCEHYEEYEPRPHGECNQCRYYEGVHGAIGHAPCSYWEIGGVLWSDYCSRFEKGGAKE